MYLALIFARKLHYKTMNKKIICLLTLQCTGDSKVTVLSTKHTNKQIIESKECLKCPLKETNQ